MQSDYALLVTTGIAGALFLLAIELIPGVRQWRKSLTAVLLSLTSLLWALLPASGEWPISIWTPSTVLGGSLVWDMTPPLWVLGLVMAVAMSSAAWIEAIESRPALPLSGTIALLSLLAAWHALAGGSLLSTLALWSVFDLLWGAAGLLSGNEGERTTFGIFANGIASLCLWAALLLLSREGGGSLWRSLWPTQPVAILLSTAAFLRMGLYPFHMVFPHRLRAVGPMTLVTVLGPILGFGFLYRLLSLPAGNISFMSVGAMGLVSLLWGGARALLARGKSAFLWASYALLGGIAGAVSLTGLVSLLPAVLGTWLLGFGLLWTLHSRDKRAIPWSWPGWIALLLLWGVPPSPLGALFRETFSTVSWGWRSMLLLGWAVTASVLVQWVQTSRHRVSASEVTLTVVPLHAWQQVGLAAGFVLPLVGLIGVTLLTDDVPFRWHGFVLWALMVVLALGLSWSAQLANQHGANSREVGRFSEWLRTGVGFVGILDLQWLYRAILRGMSHLLSVVRVLFDVVEGSSALLWSLLVLLLVYLVAVNR